MLYVIEDVYVIGFLYPFVSRGQARIRTRISAVHRCEPIEPANAAFTRVVKRLGISE